MATKRVRQFERTSRKDLEFMLQGVPLIAVHVHIHVDLLVAGRGNSRCENVLGDDIRLAAQSGIADALERYAARLPVHPVSKGTWGSRESDGVGRNDVGLNDELRVLVLRLAPVADFYVHLARRPEVIPSKERKDSGRLQV